MPLTPAEIHNIEFAKASLGKRGYDEEQVDELLDEVTREMIRLLEENDVLKRRLEGVEMPAARPVAFDDEVGAELSAVSAAFDRARYACDQADRKAAQLGRQLDEARRSAAAAASAAPGSENPDRVLSMARRTADDHLRRAHEESDAVVAEARQQCEMVARQARKLVTDITQDARRRHGEAVADIDTRRTGLLREIAELTEFAADYRAALRDHLLRQGLSLDVPAGDAAGPRPASRSAVR